MRTLILLLLMVLAITWCIAGNASPATPLRGRALLGGSLRGSAPTQLHAYREGVWRN